MEHKRLPIFSVQYHPEASPGPHDASYLFDQFLVPHGEKPEEIVHAQANRHSKNSDYRFRPDHHQPGL